MAREAPELSVAQAMLIRRNSFWRGDLGSERREGESDESQLQRLANTCRHRTAGALCLMKASWVSLTVNLHTGKFGVSAQEAAVAVCYFQCIWL